jgi:hypothetical protein
MHGKTNGSDEEKPAPPPKVRKLVWALFEEASRKIPDEALVVLGRNNPSLYTVKGRPLYVHLNGLAIVLLK